MAERSSLHMQLIISDLHLDASRPAIAEAFFTFLNERARPANSLYILGDLFEMWVGDDDDDPTIQAIKNSLRELVDSGTEVNFIHGNRDFLIGRQFSEQTGVKLLAESCVVTFDGTPCLLMHGDTLCTDDDDYQNFRQQVRQPEWQQKMLGKSLDQRRELGRELRQQSKTMSSRKSSDIMDVSQKEVERVMTELGVNTLIHGHTHRPATHKFKLNGQKAQRIVLGDWDKQGWCVELNNSIIELKNWDISN